MFFLLSGWGVSCNHMSSEEKYDMNQVMKYINEEDLNRNSEYIVILGDLQKYTHNTEYLHYFKETIYWIHSKVLQGFNIKCILQVGDITEINSHKEYEYFNNICYNVAELVPLISCIGNHDYKWDKNNKIDDRDNTLYSQYTSFPLTVSKIVDSYEKGRMENIIVKNYINDIPYYIISLEYGTRPEILRWANNFVKSNKDKNFILLTHEYLTAKGNRISSNSSAEYQFGKNECLNPEQVWMNLVYPNSNIRFVICGHNGFQAQLFSENIDSIIVPQVLFNLQYQANGGNGLIQLWEFPNDEDSAYISIYNTIYRQCYKEDDVKRNKIRYKF